MIVIHFPKSVGNLLHFGQLFIDFWRLFTCHAGHAGPSLTQHGNNWPCYFLCRLFPLHRTQISRDLLCRPRKELFCIVRIRRSAPDRCLGKFRLWADEWGWFPARSSRWAPSAWVGWRRIRRSRRTCHRDTRTCCGWCTRQSGTSRSPFYIIFGVTG